MRCMGLLSAPAPTRPGYGLTVVASPGGDIGGGRIVAWEHVSVHAVINIVGSPQSVTPTWDEMDYVKGLFWDASDVVMQLHVNDDRKVDTHKHTLHLWRPTDKEIPLPDEDLV